MKKKLSDWVRSGTKKERISQQYEFGSPVPAPPQVKRAIIRSYLEHGSISKFVETGTYNGETIDAVIDLVDEVWSIELDERLADRAVKKYSQVPKVSILQGDSAELMETVLNKLRARAVFWLDGHYSGPGTAKADKNTPIVKELTSILNHSVNNHIILIDDARLFIGQFDYPSIFDIHEMVKSKDNTLDVEFADDIIRIGRFRQAK